MITVGNKLKFVIWNCNSLNRNRVNALNVYMRESDSDVIMLTEVKQTVIAGLNRSRSYILKAREVERGGGIALVIRKRWRVKRREELEGGREVEVLWVEVEDEGLLIGVVYRRPGLTKSDSKKVEIAIREGVSAGMNEGLRVVVAGDFNAHNKEWDTNATQDE